MLGLHGNDFTSPSPKRHRNTIWVIYTREKVVCRHFKDNWSQDLSWHWCTSISHFWSGHLWGQQKVSTSLHQAHCGWGGLVPQTHTAVTSLVPQVYNWSGCTCASQKLSGWKENGIAVMVQLICQLGVDTGKAGVLSSRIHRITWLSDRNVLLFSQKVE